MRANSSAGMSIITLITFLYILHSHTEKEDSVFAGNTAIIQPAFSDYQHFPLSSRHVAMDFSQYATWYLLLSLQNGPIHISG